MDAGQGRSATSFTGAQLGMNRCRQKDECVEAAHHSWTAQQGCELLCARLPGLRGLGLALVRLARQLSAAVPAEDTAFA